MCDTFVALPDATADGSVIFAKNSDREPNEAQALEYYPAASYPAGSRVRCTYIEISQAPETYAILVSRPFWMWGAEMGANEKGVVIGNEAVWTRMPRRKTGGLTGMDLLRLGLERGATAREALQVIVELLEKHGQGGNCGYTNRHFTYHNSFLIADPREAWVLETADHLWVAKKVEKYYSISNGLTIGSHFDLSHADLIPHARRRGWFKALEEFNFAEAYSDRFYTTFSACRTRCQRTRDLLEEWEGRLDLATTFAMLRDHGEDPPYKPDRHFLMKHVCAHASASPARRAAQTTGSMVAHLKGDTWTFWFTGTAAPCLSFFKPIRFGQQTLPDLGKMPGEKYDENAMWWRHERLHRYVLEDFPTRSAAVRKEYDALEQDYLQAVAQNSGDISELTAKAFVDCKETSDGLMAMLEHQPALDPPKGSYRRYWRRLNRKAGLPQEW